MVTPAPSIVPLAASAGHAVLSRYVWAGPGWDLALHALSDGGWRVARSRWVAGVRHLWHYAWASGRLRALDHTIFLVDDDRFVEAERYRARAGPNLHAHPITLPGVLALGAPIPVVPGATVTLRYAGAARITLGGIPHDIDACCLDAEEGDRRGRHWLARGVGEIALGSVDGGYTRWMTAWRGGDDASWAPLPAALADRAEWPPLPEIAPGDGGLW